MSCSDEGGFGYVEVEKDRLKVVDGDPSNPTIRYFCSCEIVNRYNEYTKLQAINEQYKDLIIICNTITKEGTRLKVENEELKQIKKKLEKYIDNLDNNLELDYMENGVVDADWDEFLEDLWGILGYKLRAEIVLKREKSEDRK